MPVTRRRLVALAALPNLARAEAARRLVYARFSGDQHPDTLYAQQLLKAALDAAAYPATLEPTPTALPQNRALHDLQLDKGLLHVTWTMTSRERESQVLPVRVPIYRGLFGWRLLVAKQERAAELAHIESLADLRHVQLLQGKSWPDVDILRHNGVPVIASPNFEAMYAQLRLGRADAFPRSVEEVWWEMEQSGEGLAIVPGVVLHYPAAVYYFVQPSDTALAHAIELGLEKLQASGAFDRLFQAFHGANLERAKLGQRRVIELTNPLLPPKTPLSRKELWFRP